jgi:serine/threonine-protein kinase
MSDAIRRLNAALEGRYRIDGELGEGGMATVYLAEDQRHDRKVAIKVLKPELSAIIGAERFLGEIQTTANLQHPHILPLHDSGEIDGTVFYVMPLVGGESLRELMDREKLLRVADAVRIASDVADALDYAHRQGVVHRDIKPENILMHDGRALVADFGIALAASRTEGSQRLTETGMSLGTPHYMSPEQAMGEPDVDGRADIYALGCVLYEMLSGQPPFTAPNAQAIVAKLLSSEPEPLTQLRKTVPPHVAGATHTALEKLPADRFATAAEMVSALADGSWIAPSTPRAKAGGGRVGSLIPWGLAAAFLIVAIVSIAFRPRPESSPTGPMRMTLVTSSAADRTTPGTSTALGGGRLAVSREGRTVVYVGVTDGISRLFRRSLADPDVTVLPQTEGARFPAISADGRTIVFGTADGAVARMSMDGGAPTEIARPVAPPIGITWSDRHGLVFGMLGYVDDSPGISRMAVSGDTTLGFVTGPAFSEPTMHHNPVIFPDDETIGYLNIQAAGVTLSTLRLPDGEPRRTTLNARQVIGLSGGILLFMDLGGLMMAAGFDARTGEVRSGPVAVPNVPSGVSDAALASNGTLVFMKRPTGFDVVLSDERGNVVSLLPNDSTRTFRGLFSPDGSRIALSGWFGGTEGTWLFDIASSTLSPLPVRHAPNSLNWTPDGRRVVTLEGARRAPAITSVSADASDSPSPFAELPDGRRAGSASLSSDGETLAITEDVGSNPMLRELDIVLLDLSDGSVTDFATGPANELAPRFSTDGRWLAYASNESGRYEVYVRPFPGPGGRIQVSAGGGSEPVWSPDGRRLYYRLGRALLSADLTESASGELRVASRTRLFEDEFYGADREDALEATYDVSPDGTRFLFARAKGGAVPEIVIWTDWLGEVRELLESGG